MIDPRVTRLAELLCGHSLELASSDRLLIHAFDMPDEVTAEVVRVAQTSGAQVLVRLESNLVKRQLLLNLTPETARTMAAVERFEMEQMTAYLALRGSSNSSQFSDVPELSQKIWSKEYVQPVVYGVRIPSTKWVVLRWPTAAMAQQANVSTPAFEKFFFDVCTLDYGHMAKASAPLQELMSRTDKVSIVGPGTDFSFSIKDIGAVACTGGRNIPDGECFSAPVLDSVNGVVQFNTVSLYQGTEFKDIRYVIKNGQIVDGSAGTQTARLNEILDTDEGARYFGEWSLGFNPYILEPMRDTLFDEKIAGSFHFTPGFSYDPPGGNGNKSAIHWDTVLIQRPEYGGGEIYFDDVLIRKDGIFLLPELQGLNPANFAQR